MKDDELTTVFSSEELTGNAEAEVLRSLLDSAGIPAVIRWVPPTFQRPGGIRLLVLSSDKPDAELVIQQAQEPG